MVLEEDGEEGGPGDVPKAAEVRPAAGLLDRIRSPQGAAWLTLALIAASFALGALTSPLVFDTNDDAAMLGISAGFFGEHVGDPRLVYQSAFLGLLLGGLFSLFGGFDWYSAFQWSVCVAAYATILYTLLRSTRAPWMLPAVAFAALAFLPPTLFRIQFTQTAFACVAAASVILVDLERRRSIEPPSRKSLVVRVAAALIFCLLAVSLRAATLPVATALILGTGLLIATRTGLQGRSALALSSLFGWSAFAILLFVSSTGLGWLEERVFYSDPAWNAFYHHHADRAFVLENWPRWIGVERISAALQATMGITAEQLAAMARWIPVDAELYSVEGFREMASIVRGLESDGPFQAQRLTESVASLRVFVSETAVFGSVLAWIILFSALRAAADARHRLAILFLMATFVVLPLLFWLQVDLLFRPPPYRVWMPFLALDVWIFLALHGLIAAGGAEEREQREERQAFGETESSRVADPSKASALFRPAFACAVLLAAGLFPLHLDVARLLAARSSGRENACAMTAAHLWALEQRPADSRVFVAPLVIYSECYVSPFRIRMPETLLSDVHFFGWRNLVPFVREELFAGEVNVFDSICASPENMLVMHPGQRPYAEHYLSRHRPDLVLGRYSPRLPEAVLSCRRLGPGATDAQEQHAAR